MKNLTLSTLSMIIGLFSNVQAATIFEIQDGVSIYANDTAGHSGQYYDQTFNGDVNSPPISGADIKAAVTGNDLTKYARTFDYHIPTGPDNAYIDLTFGSDIYNGEGDDLVLFFAGNATVLSSGLQDYLFSIDVGADGSIEGSIDGTIEGGQMGVTDSTTFYNTSGVLENLPAGITADTITVEQKALYKVDFFASYALIDLDTFGFDQTTPLGDIRIYLGDKSIPALSGLGAYHLTAVPLPLSSVLFGSGLALLSLFRRKKI